MNKNYDPADYMPKATETSDEVRAVLASQDSEPDSNKKEQPSEQNPTLEPSVALPSDDISEAAQELSGSCTVADPEQGPVEFGGEPSRWATFVSAFFSPLLIPTYCIALAMWITPLSHISENTRLLATIVILAMTALLPTACMAALVRTGRRPGFDHSTRQTRLVPAATFVVCMLLAAYYLYNIYAPAWLSMILVAGAATTVAFIVINLFIFVSGHACAISALCAVAMHLGRTGLSDVPMTPWLIAFVLIAGFVGSARLELRRHKFSEIAIGYAIGFIITILVLNLHLFDARPYLVQPGI